jgi:hypothetical protein
MALPNNISTITVTGQYLDFTGSAVAGQVRFTNPQFLVNSNADRMIVPTTITATLDNTGAFSVTIPITNDADLSPLNFTYTYEEAFVGGSTFTISLPASLGGSVDISDLRPQAPVSNYYQPVSGLLWPLLVARVAQEEEDLDDNPKLLAQPTYANLTLYLDTYTNLATEFVTYNRVDGTNLDPELNFTQARIREIIDRIADLYDFTASSLELRDTTGSGTVTSTTYGALTAKRGTYQGFATNTSPSTYAQASSGVSWTYAQIGTLITQLGFALNGTGTLTDPYLSITRTSVDGSYGAFGLQGLTYATLASTYATYGATTGASFSFTYRDTADIIRTEANRVNRLALIGAKP